MIKTIRKWSEIIDGESMKYEEKHVKHRRRSIC